MISAVFEQSVQAANALEGSRKRHPDQHFIICEIREIL